MNPRLRQFFDTHHGSTAAHRDEQHAQIAAVQRVCRAVMSHLLDLQEKLHEAETESHDGKLNPKLHDMHVRIESALNACRSWQNAGRELARILDALEQSLTQDALDVKTVLAAVDGDAAIDRVVLTPAQHQAFIDRAEKAEAEVARLKALLSSNA